MNVKPDLPFFDEEKVEKLLANYQEVQWSYVQLLSKFSGLKTKNQETSEYIKHGYIRRMNTLKRCLENVFKLCPPNDLQKMPHDIRIDLTINIQCFLFNTFGVIDNLAWIWVKETNFAIKANKDVSFNNKSIKKILSREFQTYLSTESHREWLLHIEQFRHALAHRIPLYIPPSAINQKEKEQLSQLENSQTQAIKENDLEKANRIEYEIDNLGKFLPVFTHSYSENSPQVVFHPQLIADWNTLIEFSDELYAELNRKS